MPDVAKLKKRALEYEQKKQFDKALDTYTLVLAELDEHVDEADVALYNRVGDLLLRRGDVSEAVDHYEKAVDLYTDGGFFNNAIALCNKILRNAPGRNSVYYKLGKISARKGFINDAKQNFLEYADRMQKSGHLEEAFRALKEFADLCPDQTDIRLMLADQLVRKDRKSEAIEQLHALYEKFSAEGRSAEARATVDRMKALDPAIEPKEVVRPTSPKGGDLVFLDVNYDEPSRPISAQPAASSAPGANKTAWTVVHPTTPSATPAVAIEMPLIDPDEEIVIDLDTASAIDVPPLPGLSHGAILPDGSATAGDGIVSHVDLGLITGFENSDEVGDDEPARDIAPLAELEHHSHVVMPETITHDADDAATSIPSMLDDLQLEEIPSMELHSIELEDEPPTSDLPMLDVPFDEEDNAPSVGGALTFISVERDPEPLMPEPEREALDVERSPTLEMDAIVPDGGPPLPLLDLDERTSNTSGMDREHALTGLPMLEPEPEEQPADAHASALFADDDIDESVELVWQTEPADVPAAVVPEPPAPPAPPAPPEPAAPREPLAPPPLSRADQLRRALSQNPSGWDLHRQLAEALLEEGDRGGGMMELEATMFGYEREGNLAAASRSANELIRVEPNSVRYHQKRVEYAVRANDKSQLVDAYLALAESLFRSGQLDKSRAVYGRVLELSPADARATSALHELGVDLEPPPAEPEIGLDAELFAALETALPEPPLREPAVTPPPAREPVAASGDETFVNLADWMREEEAPKSTRMVVPDSEDEPSEQVEFGEMLAKFKQGVTSNVDDTDHESHYDLGIAYKEMGLLDEAISEFQKALRGTEQRVRTYEALGQCFVEKRQYQIAMTILLRALNDAQASDDTLVGILYLLGYASESLQKWGDAVGYYERVFTVDIQFRDVGDRLATVERKAR
jgi:tetratricopeptide (TPR) repeat protein